MLNTEKQTHPTTAEASNPSLLPLIRKALLIRRFEERLLHLFSEGKLNGTVHTCVGQEWSGVAVNASLLPQDIVFSNHRGHGHYLSRYEDLVGLFAEVMGRAIGIAGGMGGSQHLVGPSFYSNGIQGGMTPVATGAALAFKLQGLPYLSVAFIGDGTLGEGILYESLNIASKWQVPLLIVVENNDYAQSTNRLQTQSGSVEKRAAAFDLHYDHGSTWEWEDLLVKAQHAVDYVRSKQQPAILEIKTYRLNAHSKGDDNRDVAEVERYRQMDPLNVWARANPNAFVAIDREVSQRISEAVEEADRSPLCEYRPALPSIRRSPSWRTATVERERHVDSIYRALVDGFESNPRLIMLGEDIEGAYGGAFKATRDLSLRFPGRVRNTPISEAALVGISSGLALNGQLALVEIMFGDFLTLTFDQLYQHAAKFQIMYNGRCSLPMIVRTPMGGRRGYGPTHSQSIEKFFLGIPGLKVIALNNRYSPFQAYQTLFRSIDGPSLVIENKILYTRFLETTSPDGFKVECSDDLYPTVRISPTFADPEVTLVCYGGMLEEAEIALNRLLDEHDIVCEIICPMQLYPLNADPIVASVAKTSRLLTVEEGPMTAGFGAEVISNTAEAGILLRHAKRLGFDGVIPACHALEMSLLPTAATIVDAVTGMF